MSALLKSCTCIMFGGGLCSVPFLNLSPFPSTSHTSSNRSPRIDNTSSATEVSDERSGNCLFDYSLEEAFTKHSEILNSHISFSCNSGGNDNSKIKGNWRIWVPVGLIKDSWSISTEGKKISIKTQTEDISRLEDLYDGVYENKTTFTSDSFINSSIIGEWGSGITIEGSDQVYRVKVSLPESANDPIFLKLK